jgi:hypothetical protein
LQQWETVHLAVRIAFREQFLVLSSQFTVLSSQWCAGRFSEKAGTLGIWGAYTVLSGIAVVVCPAMDMAVRKWTV